MSDAVLLGILSLVGTLAGTFGGILVSNKLTNYRLEQLEKKVHAHNNLVERTYHLEGELELVHEQSRVANHRIGDLERADHRPALS